MKQNEATVIIKEKRAGFADRTMTASNFDEREIRRFLLGELHPDERLRVEEQFLIDPTYREQLLAVEGELIDDYLDDALSPNERKKFSRHMAGTPEQQERIRMARLITGREGALRKFKHPSESHAQHHAKQLSGGSFRKLQNQRIWLPIAAILIIAIGFGVFSALMIWRSYNEGLDAEKYRSRIELELAQLNHEPRKLPHLDSTLSSATLLPVSTRQVNSTPALSPPPSSEIVELQLVLDGNAYSNYTAEIQKVTNPERFVIPNLHVDTSRKEKAVVVWLPNNFLRDGEYRISLRAQTTSEQFEEVGEYSFQIKRY
jgi:hypothetical protein